MEGGRCGRDAMAAGVTCQACGHRVKRCPECGEKLLTHTVNINKVKDVSVTPNAVVLREGPKESVQQRGSPASVMRRTPEGVRYIHKADNVFITQNVINVNIDSNSSVTLSVATDREDLQDVSKDVFLINTEWTQSNAERSPAPDGASRPRDGGAPDIETQAGSTSTHAEQNDNQTLVTRIISHKTQTLFEEVMGEIQKDNLPERVVTELLSKFKVELMGLTKRLEVYLKVRHGDMRRVLSLEKDIQFLLADLLLPQHARGEVQFQRLSHVSVQCSHDLQSTNQKTTEPNAKPSTEPAKEPTKEQGPEDQEYLIPEEKNTTSLHRAVRHNRTSLIEDLLSTGIDMDARDGEGMTPLHVAVVKDSQMAVQILINAGARTDMQCNRGLMPLHIAVVEDRVNLIKLLLRKTRLSSCKAIGINVRDEKGKTPLHFANSLAATRLLLDAGANINAQCSRGRTPLHEAASNGQTEVLILLLDHAAKVDVHDEDGRTALMIACSRGKTGNVQLLLSYDANPSEVDRWGNTALHLASKKGDGHTVAILLSHKAPVNAINTEGRTALDYASMYSNTANPEPWAKCVKLLESRY